ncbi:TetR/AcrR family transcriptional regulator [Bacillus haynesii]|uniref:TetR/AcrR family transcriptional regulator n=1 Tax=Bacillus haynesii TaxID=1925021 RepID=UPI0022817CDA|nr:TetR/AcrR family transcriptional regulator [Bacillus haynesii]MCY7914456.1 TetR/AcrR family transcriptional regulator [Bacillus haynesii]
MSVPKFTEKEKEAIRSALVHSGRELFAQLGLKKTSVSELTASAGIAQGSFYTFFDSKGSFILRFCSRKKKRSALNLKPHFLKAGKHLHSFCVKHWR